MSADKRKFVVFEGPEFSGKSTLHKAVVAKLNERNEAVVALREPGGTELGERLRKVLLSEYNETVHPETDVLVHMAYRVQNVRELIAPALQEGKWVVLDRFMYSTWCMNVQANLPTHPYLPELFMSLMPTVTGGLIPEPVVFLVNTPKEIRLQRAAVRKETVGLDRYELLDEATQLRIDASFEQLAGAPSTVVLDGTLSLEEQVDFVLTTMDAHFVRIAEIEADEAKRKEELLKVTEGKSDEAEQNVQSDPVPDPSDSVEDDFDLESALEKYAQENIVDGLFDEVPTTELEAVKAHYREVAVDVVRDIFTHTGGDKTIFMGSRVGQLNAKIHSLIHYGHKLAVREKMLANKKAVQGQLDESNAG